LPAGLSQRRHGGPRDRRGSSIIRRDNRMPILSNRFVVPAADHRNVRWPHRSAGATWDRPLRSGPLATVAQNPPRASAPTTEDSRALDCSAVAASRPPVRGSTFAPRRQVPRGAPEGPDGRGRGAVRVVVSRLRQTASRRPSSVLCDCKLRGYCRDGTIRRGGADRVSPTPRRVSSGTNVAARKKSEACKISVKEAPRQPSGGAADLIEAT